MLVGYVCDTLILGLEPTNEGVGYLLQGLGYARLNTL